MAQERELLGARMGRLSVERKQQSNAALCFAEWAGEAARRAAARKRDGATQQLAQWRALHQ